MYFRSDECGVLQNDCRGGCFFAHAKAKPFEAIRLARLFGAQLVLVHVGVKSSIKAEKINRVFEAFGEKPPRHEMVWQEGTLLMCY